MVAQEVDFRAKEFGLFWIAVKMGVLQGLQDHADIANMFFHSLRPNYDVVQVDMADFANMFAKNQGDTALMYGKCIFQTHRHNEPLIKSEGCGNSSKVGIVRMHLSLKK